MYQIWHTLLCSWIENAGYQFRPICSKDKDKKLSVHWTKCNVLSKYDWLVSTVKRIPVFQMRLLLYILYSGSVTHIKLFVLCSELWKCSQMPNQWLRQRNSSQRFVIYFSGMHSANFTQSTAVGVHVLFQLHVICWEAWKVLGVFLNCLAVPQ